MGTARCIAAMVLVAGSAACGDGGDERGAGDVAEVADTGAPDGADTVAPDGDDTSAPDGAGDTVVPDGAGDTSVPDADDDTAAPDTDDDTSAPDADDTAAPDAEGGVPLPGFGAISGACGVLDDELTAPTPSLFVSHIDFGADAYDDGDLAALTDGGREILEDGNAGGSSILSEVFAFELLARCEGATLLKTETEVVYDVAAKITDMIVLIDGLKIGANPTRAIGFPFDAPYTADQARTVIEKKLNDINSSTAAVSADDRWVKQILTVFAYDEPHVAAIEEAWATIDPALKADTIVLVTVTDGADQFIYSND